LFVSWLVAAKATNRGHNPTRDPIAQEFVVMIFNTDPGKATRFDASAARWNDFVGQGKPFHFISRVGADAKRSYLGLADMTTSSATSFMATVGIRASMNIFHPVSKQSILIMFR